MDFQLWIQNHKNANLSVASGNAAIDVHTCVTSSRSAATLVPLVLSRLADHNRVLEQGSSGYGGPRVPVGIFHDTDEGFLHDGALTVGVHMSVNAKVGLMFCMVSNNH